MPDELLDEEQRLLESVVEEIKGRLLSRDGGFKVRDLEGICLPPYEDCTNCWQRDRYCIDPAWQITWKDLQDDPDKYWK